MRFLSVFKAPEGAPPTEKEAAEMGALIGEMAAAGVLLAAEGCLPSSRGARVRLANGMFTVTDGPFTESKELIGGFAILQTSSMSEAVEWTKRFIRVAGDGAFAGVEGSVATAVYRALQESLTNIARHSGAKNAWVSLTIEDGRLHFEVEDDGRGVLPEDLAKARSLGLKGMRERVTYLGGAFDVGRAPRGGTRVRAQLPARSTREGETA